MVLPSADCMSPPQPGRWASLISSEGVTVWNSVPAFAELLVSQLEHEGTQLAACLRVVLMSGDWISLSLPRRLQQASGPTGLRVVSMGGATEAAVWSVTYEMGWDGQIPSGWNSVPYGIGMRNQSIDVYVEGADGSLELSAPWSSGMIYIGGAGVALGYFGDAARARLREPPRTGEYMFRTGDGACASATAA